MLWSKQKKTFFDHFILHSRESLAAAHLLKQLLIAQSPALELARQIKAHEHAADLVTHAVVNQLNETFIHPIDREDIVEFNKALDDIVDDIHHAAEAYARIFELSSPLEAATHFSEVIVQACDQVEKICGLLNQPSRNLALIKNHCVEIHRLENEGDELLCEALHLLFARLKNDQIHIALYLAWNDIYKLLEQVTDRTEDCANIAEQIAMKYS